MGLRVKSGLFGAQAGTRRISSGGPPLSEPGSASRRESPGQPPAGSRLPDFPTPRSDLAPGPGRERRIRDAAAGVRGHMHPADSTRTARDGRALEAEHSESEPGPRGFVLSSGCSTAAYATVPP